MQLEILRAKDCYASLIRERSFRNAIRNGAKTCRVV